MSRKHETSHILLFLTSPDLIYEGIGLNA